MAARGNMGPGTGMACSKGARGGCAVWHDPMRRVQVRSRWTACLAPPVKRACGCHLRTRRHPGWPGHDPAHAEKVVEIHRLTGAVKVADAEMGDPRGKSEPIPGRGMWRHADRNCLAKERQDGAQSTHPVAAIDVSTVISVPSRVMGTTTPGMILNRVQRRPAGGRDTLPQSDPAG